MNNLVQGSPCFTAFHNRSFVPSSIGRPSRRQQTLPIASLAQAQQPSNGATARSSNPPTASESPEPIKRTPGSNGAVSPAAPAKPLEDVQGRKLNIVFVSAEVGPW